MNLTLLAHAPSIALKKYQIHKKIKSNPPEIIAVLCVYNEELNIDSCLAHLEKYVDKIVVLDDCSTDNTVSIVKKHKKVSTIIENKNKTSWKERQNRELVIKTAFNVAENKSNAWAFCVDADERFEKRFLKDLKKITALITTPIAVIHMRELWGDIYHYRMDGIWSTKRKDLLFKLSDKMTFSYKNEHHIPWHYSEIDGQETVLDYNFYHLKMIRPEDRKKRADLYNTLDPKKKMQSIGYDYLVDENNLFLEKIKRRNRYDYRFVPNYYKNF